MFVEERKEGKKGIALPPPVSPRENRRRKSIIHPEAAEEKRRSRRKRGGAAGEAVMIGIVMTSLISHSHPSIHPFISQSTVVSSALAS